MADEEHPEDKGLLADDRIAGLISGAVMCAFVVDLIVCIGTLIINGAHWLKYGSWPNPKAADWFGYGPYTDWVGLNRLLTCIMDLPAVVVLFFTGMSVAWLVTAWADGIAEKARDARMRRARRKAGRTK